MRNTTLDELLNCVAELEVPGAALLHPKEVVLLYCKAALERCNGNKSQAARVLGVSRTSLWRILHKEFVFEELVLPQVVSNAMPTVVLEQTPKKFCDTWDKPVVRKKRRRQTLRSTKNDPTDLSVLYR